MRTLVPVLLLVTSLLSPVSAMAEGARWSLGGRAALAWAGGWPSLDLRLRWGHHVSGGHALGLTAGLSTERLASQVVYLSEYSHTWIEGRAWPVVSLWLGGSTEIVGIVAQSRLVLGVAFGVRLRVGRRVVVRLELAHELLSGHRWIDRTFFVLGLEYLGGAWPTEGVDTRTEVSAAEPVE